MTRSIRTTFFLSAFVLGIICPILFAQDAVPGSLLHLDANMQHPRDTAWNNLGVLGGKLGTARGDATPELKDGEIRIPQIGFTRKAKWYTAKGVGRAFAGVGGKAGELKIKDWTLEFLARRNGAKWPGQVLAAEFAGFHAENRESQGLRILMHGGDTGKLILWMKGKNSPKAKWFGADKLKIDLGKDDWHWIAFVFNNKKTLETYLDGKRVGRIETDQSFDGETPMSTTVFSAWDHRSFNGSISIVRIYGRPLSQKELNLNISGDLRVGFVNKLATTWGKVRTGSDGIAAAD